MPGPTDRRRTALSCAVAGALLVVAAAGLAVGSGAPTGVAAGAVAVAAVLLGTFVGALLARPDGRYGPADTVTLVRAALGSWCATWTVLALAGHLPAQSWVLLTVAVTALVLDGVDGAVARRTGLAGVAGGRLDAETDAALILVLSLLASLTVGWWVLLAGGMRYAFLLGQGLRPRWRGATPARRSRRVVAATQGGVLAGICAPIVSQDVAVVAAAVGLVLLTLSFTRDVLWLERQG